MIRLLHRSTVIKISGNSYRMMAKKKAGMKPAGEEAKKAPEGRSFESARPVKGRVF